MKKVHPTLFPSTFQRMSSQFAAGWNLNGRFYSNEPKHSWILKTIIPLITPLNAVIRRIVIIFPSLKIVLVDMSS